ncbi:hypothetical protein Plhal710r2_c064g0173421 [Plasmopara halstedii]
MTFDLKRLYNSCEVKLCDWVESKNKPEQEQLNIDYSRISAYNMKMIQHFLGEADRVKDRLANIES